MIFKVRHWPEPRWEKASLSWEGLPLQGCVLCSFHLRFRQFNVVL